MYDAADIVRRARRVGLLEPLEEIRALDALLSSRSPYVQQALARDGHLLPIHRRMNALCRRIAFAVEKRRAEAAPLARWLLLHSGELARAATAPVSQQAALLETVFAVDLWVGLRLGLLDYLRLGEPPERKTDLEFYENRDADHRRITGYANGLSRIRDHLLELAGAADCRPRLDNLLDFDPLAALSPLDAHRDCLLRALGELTRAVQPAHHGRICSLVEARRSAARTPADPPEDLPRHFRAVLTGQAAAAPGPGMPELVALALAEGAAQVGLPSWEPEARQRQALAGALQRLAGSERPGSVDLLRLRLEVLELADISGEPQPPAFGLMLPTRRSVLTPSRAAWLRLYVALVLLDRPDPDGLDRPEPAEPDREATDAAARCARLLRMVSDPPRINAPGAEAFRAAMRELEQLLLRDGGSLPEEQLVRITALQDVCREVSYYLEDDPLYDAGHDWVEADYGALRAAAAGELARRAKPPAST